jgi:hypothetical protein
MCFVSHYWSQAVRQSKIRQTAIVEKENEKLSKFLGKPASVLTNGS